MTNQRNNVFVFLIGVLAILSLVVVWPRPEPALAGPVTGGLTCFSNPALAFLISESSFFWAVPNVRGGFFLPGFQLTGVRVGQFDFPVPAPAPTKSLSRRSGRKLGMTAVRTSGRISARRQPRRVDCVHKVLRRCPAHRLARAVAVPVVRR